MTPCRDGSRRFRPCGYGGAAVRTETVTRNVYTAPNANGWEFYENGGMA